MRAAWKLGVVLALAAAGCGVGGTEGRSGGVADDPDGQVVIDRSGDGQTFTVVEGQKVVVRLASNASTGYSWVVARTDRTFGYPASDEMETNEDGPIGSGGMQVLTWESKGFLPMVGLHEVTLEYRRPWEENVEAEDTFSFAVDITAAEDVTLPVVIDESGDGETFVAIEGQQVVVRLGANPSTGYKWIVTRTNRTFGYPVTDEMEMVEDGPIGSGGTQVLTWETTGFLPMVGTHEVTIEYRRPWEDETVEAARTFSFTLEIQAAQGEETDVALSIGEADDGGTFVVDAGGVVELRLSSNPTTGYDWVVTRVDRTFGYPETSFEPDGDAVGSGGMTVMRWQTTGFLPMAGVHQVELGYRRAWEDESVPSARTFSFTVEIVE